METFSYKNNKFKCIPCVIAIGVFDGIHIGHIKILKECVETAKKLNVKSMVMTFSVNPKMLCGNETPMKNLLDEKIIDNLLSDLGLDYHCIIDFSIQMSKISGEEFIAGLCTSYDVRAMVVGESFRCGNSNNSVGSAEISSLLSRFTSSAFLKVVPSVFLNGERVSSSLIRRCLLTGDLDKVSKLLGRPYNLENKSDTAVKK